LIEIKKPHSVSPNEAYANIFRTHFFLTHTLCAGQDVAPFSAYSLYAERLPRLHRTWSLHLS